MKFPTALLYGSLILLAACDSPAGPSDGLQDHGPSSASFAYHGAGPEGSISGAYQVLGDPDLGKPQVEQTFAHGQRVRRAGAFRAISMLQRTARTSDWIVVTVPRLTTGTVTLDPFCGAEYCPQVFIALELGANHGEQAKYSCTLERGTVRVTTITDKRAKGEFSGTGTCIGAKGTAGLEEFTVSEGRFDVKLSEVQS